MSTSSIKTTVRQLGELHVRILEAGREGTPEVLLIHGGLGDAHLHWHKTLAALGILPSRLSFHPFATWAFLRTPCHVAVLKGRTHSEVLPMF